MKKAVKCNKIPTLKLLVNILECGFFCVDYFGSSRFKSESGSGNSAVGDNSERVNSPRRYFLNVLIPSEAPRRRTELLFPYSPASLSTSP